MSAFFPNRKAASFTNADSVALTEGMPVVMVSPGSVRRADPSQTGLQIVVGIVAVNAAVGAQVAVYVDGTVSSSVWNSITGETIGLTTGSTYYLGSLPGTLTAVELSASQSVAIGTAISATELVLGIRHPVSGTTQQIQQGVDVTAPLADRVCALEALLSRLVFYMDGEGINLPLGLVDDVAGLAGASEEN